MNNIRLKNGVNGGFCRKMFLADLSVASLLIYKQKMKSRDLRNHTEWSNLIEVSELIKKKKKKLTQRQINTRRFELF